MKGEGKMKYIRCGQCCIHAPCLWAQFYHGYTKSNYTSCKELVKNDDGSYTCKMFSRDSNMRQSMLDKGCEYPDWRKERTLVVFGQQWQTVNTLQGKAQ